MFGIWCIYKKAGKVSGYEGYCVLFWRLINAKVHFFRYRDKHDELAKAFQMYSEEEPFNKGTAVALDSLTKAITFLADYMDMEVQRLESKVRF